MPHGDRYGQPPPTAANSVNPSAGGGIRGFAVPGPECLRPAAGGRLFREPGWRRDRGFQPSSRTAHLEWANLEWTNEERTSKSAIPPPGSGARRVARHPNLRRFQRFPWFQRQGAFGVGQVAFDQFPLHIWSKLVARRCRNMKAESFQYGDRTGFRLLRETPASYLRTSRSLHCEAEQVMIVAGSQQALEISARVLLDPGSSVWVEQPGYRLAPDAFVLNGCNLVPVPIDEEGLDVAAGIRRCPEARAALVTPSHQYPLGVTMSASRRFQLLEWALATGSWIIEDDYDSEYRYESLPIASLQGLDASARVIYVGTFSKVLF